MRSCTGPAGAIRRASSGRDSDGEARAPAAHVGDRGARHPEQREACAGGDVPAQPDDLRGRAVALILAERRRLQNAYELGVVLAHDRRRRDGVRGLVVLALGQRRAVDRGEDGEPEADDEERDGDCRPARVARERECREPERERPAASCTLEQPRDEADCAGGEDGGDEDDEAGEEEQHRSRPLAACEAARVGRSAGEGDDDHDRRGHRREVERREAEAAELDLRRPHGGKQDRGSGDDERDRDGEPRSGQDRVRDDRGSGRSEVTGDRQRGKDPGEPADRGPGCGDRGRLGT